jgi:hypothetical protein
MSTRPVFWPLFPFRLPRLAYYLPLFRKRRYKLPPFFLSVHTYWLTRSAQTQSTPSESGLPGGLLGTQDFSQLCFHKRFHASRKALFPWFKLLTLLAFSLGNTGSVGPTATVSIEGQLPDNSRLENKPLTDRRFCLVRDLHQASLKFCTFVPS